MSKSMLASLAAVLVVLLAGSSAHAQRPGMPVGQPSVNGAVALLDVSYVFKNHLRFKAMMEEMQRDVEAAEMSMKKEREAIKALAERLEQYRAGSPEYKQIEEELAKRQSELAVTVQLQKKDFLQREAKIYHNVYQEIMQEVEYYAANNGISLVLRFNGDQVDVQKPDDVLRDINKQVIYYPKDRDITPYILERLNRPGMNNVGGRQGVPMPQGVPVPR